MKSNEIKKTVEFFFAEDKDKFVCLLCGSAVNNNKIEELRDVDFFIYTLNGASNFCKKFMNKLKRLKIEFLYKYNDVLNIYSIKFRCNGFFLSFHIANYTYIKKLVKIKGNKNIYDLDLFSWKFNIATAYRTWMIDTEYILGNQTMLDDVKNEFANFVIPSDTINYIKEKLQLALNYSYELIQKNAIGEKIIIMEICQLLVSFVYCYNNCCFSTIKHIERDLTSFKKHKNLCSICLDIFQNKNKDYLALVNEIQEILEQNQSDMKD